MKLSRRVILSAAPLALLLCGSAWAQSLPAEHPLAVQGFTPQVPVSALARPLAWFDRSRLQISTSVSVGSGFGRGADALQVTSLSYQFGAPLRMAVSLGNSWGLSSGRSGSSFFLEGMDIAYRPHPSFLLQVHYQDLRSPLQLSPFFSRANPWGY